MTRPTTGRTNRRPAPATRQPTPWVVPDLFRWFGLLGLAAVGLVMAWWGVSGSTRTDRLITWTNVGTAAVVLSGLANMTWLLQGRRAVSARRRELLAAAASIAMAPGAVATLDDVRVAVPGTSRHHRVGCPSVSGKPVERGTVADHERAGRHACGLCG